MTEYLPHLLTPGATQVPTGALLPGLSVAVDVSHYDVIEQVIDKLPAPRQRSYTIKLDKCPKCDAPIVERTDVRDPTHALVCRPVAAASSIPSIGTSSIPSPAEPVNSPRR